MHGRHCWLTKQHTAANPRALLKQSQCCETSLQLPFVVLNLLSFGILLAGIVGVHPPSTRHRLFAEVHVQLVELLAFDAQRCASHLPRAKNNANCYASEPATVLSNPALWPQDGNRELRRLFTPRSRIYLEPCSFLNVANAPHVRVERMAERLRSQLTLRLLRLCQRDRCKTDELECT